MTCLIGVIPTHFHQSISRKLVRMILLAIPRISNKYWCPFSNITNLLKPMLFRSLIISFNDVKNSAKNFVSFGNESLTKAFHLQNAKKDFRSACLMVHSLISKLCSVYNNSCWYELKANFLFTNLVLSSMFSIFLRSRCYWLFGVDGGTRRSIISKAHFRIDHIINICMVVELDDINFIW